MKYIANEYEDHNLYYSLADQSQHALHHVTQSRIMADQCLFALFGTHVVIAGSHLFESSMPSRVPE